jgi:hypothetical protein
MKQKNKKRVNEERMVEMEKSVPQKVGSIVAYCKAGKMGLILKKEKKGNDFLWTGRILDATKIDAEYRILQIKDGKLLNKKWQSSDPDPIGFLPPEEVKALIDGGVVNRGCD